MLVTLYCGLQIYHGFFYGMAAFGGKMLTNLAYMILVYLGLTLLQCNPERVNGLTKEACTKEIRTYTVRMVRIAKLIYSSSLFFTSILDVMGKEINGGYSLVTVVLIVVTALIYGIKIIRIIKGQRKK